MTVKCSKYYHACFFIIASTIFVLKIYEHRLNAIQYIRQTLNLPRKRNGINESTAKSTRNMFMLRVAQLIILFTYFMFIQSCWYLFKQHVYTIGHWIYRWSQLALPFLQKLVSLYTTASWNIQINHQTHLNTLYGWGGKIYVSCCLSFSHKRPLLKYKKNTWYSFLLKIVN